MIDTMMGKDGSKQMETALQTIKGIGPGRERQFHRLGVRTIPGLLTYFPRAYENRSHIVPLRELKAGETAAVIGTIAMVQEKRPRRGLSILEIVLADSTGRCKIVFFNQSYKKNMYKKGLRLYAYGKVDMGYGALQMNTPHVEMLYGDQQPDTGIVPVYPLVEGVSQYIVRQALTNWFAAHRELPDILPPEVSEAHSFMTRYAAFKEMHFPSTPEAYKAARRQLAYEELFVMQAGLLLLRSRQQAVKGVAMKTNGPLITSFLASLPFTLTGDQQRAFQEIATDMEDTLPMQRLLQGDVGSGKTVVGALALLKAVENGYQGALMAPTEILAQQHYESITAMCSTLDVTLALLTGSTKAKEKQAIYEGLAAGTIDIVIGTHALIQEGVHFNKLALTIIDEQHRFGVEQRARLQQKGMNPHVLVMTATPIPRTMTLSIYGDLEVSAIKEMPPGRKPVQTFAVNSSYKERMRNFFAKEMEAGHQVYVVCPLVEESEKLDLQAAEALYMELAAYYHGRFAVGMVHGRMSAAEKEEVMEAFHRRDIQLLVSTTVIEVGVNVPNATIMCVEGAERFGLSQLHQLRGRVGRGDAQAYCILVSDSRNEESKKRLHLMETIQDGFVLAEQDLLLRGAGQLFGLMQHGLPDLKVADIVRDIDMLAEARRDAKAFIAKQGFAYCAEKMKPELEQRFGDDFIRILYS